VIRLSLSLSLILALSCDGSTPPTPQLSWRFADERPCDLAGVVDVTVVDATSGRRLETFRCRQGLAPASVQLTSASPSLVLEARSLTGALLYRASVEVDEHRSHPITLRFLGGHAE
jgi:hypothetical protein